MTDDRPGWILRAPAAGVTALLLGLASITVADSDLWGHLRFGLDTLATWTLPSIDPYSFTQDLPWINHEWLSELIMALAWSAGGSMGLAVLKGALVAAALALVWQALRPADLGVRIVIFAATAAATAPVARTLRPQLWTLLFLVILARLLVERRLVAQRWLPVMFAAWANVHGGWVVGYGVLVAWVAAEAVIARRLSAERIVVVAFSLIATLATPYGWRLWIFLGSTVRMGRDITEWQPLWRVAPVDVVPWIATVGFAVWVVRFSPRNLWPRVAVLAMLAYSSARVVRIGPLFAACAAVVLADAAAARWPRRAGRLIDSSPHDRLAATVIAAATIAAAVWLGTSAVRCIEVETPRAADAAAVRLLQGAPSGRVVTFFDWGQYAIWHLGPRLRVSMDGRRETVYSDARLDEHAAILDGRADGFAALAAWQPEYVWLPASSAATRAWLLERGYRLEHDTDRSFVAVRPDLSPLTPGSAVPPARAACFPG